MLQEKRKTRDKTGQEKVCEITVFQISVFFYFIVSGRLDKCKGSFQRTYWMPNCLIGCVLRKTENISKKYSSNKKFSRSLFPKKLKKSTTLKWMNKFRDIS